MKERKKNVYNNLPEFSPFTFHARSESIIKSKMNWTKEKKWFGNNFLENTRISSCVVISLRLSPSRTLSSFRLSGMKWRKKKCRRNTVPLFCYRKWETKCKWIFWVTSAVSWMKTKSLRWKRDEILLFLQCNNSDVAFSPIFSVCIRQPPRIRKSEDARKGRKKKTN